MRRASSSASRLCSEDGTLGANCYIVVEKGSVESTHKVPTSHYHAKHSLALLWLFFVSRFLTSVHTDFRRGSRRRRGVDVEQRC